MYKIDTKKLDHSPRAVKFWECCLAKFYEDLSSFKRKKSSADSDFLEVNINQIVHTEKKSSCPLDEAFRHFVRANKAHRAAYEFSNQVALKKQIFERRIKPNPTKKSRKSLRQEFIVNNQKRLPKFRIAVANTKVLESNIKAALRGEANFGGDRFTTLYKIFKQAKDEKADILLFPECFVPVDLLDRITWYAATEQKLIVTGLEHITIDKVAFNFIVTILPFETNGVKDAVVVYRLKNHYSHGESLMIKSNHFYVPKPKESLYDLFIWKGLYFSPYYCFELADVQHRSLFKGKIDLLIGSEWNPDTNYFSNIVESISRDLHVYVAQVNTSQFGDTRITQPSKTELKDILKLKGGENDTVLIGEIDVKGLREFQRELYIATKDHKNYKPLPPNFSIEDVLRRINNKSVL